MSGINIRTEPDGASDGAYRLIRACYDSLDQARELLRREPTLVRALTGLGETALHFLAVEDQLDAVKLLFEHGAPLDTQNRFGDSALAQASSLGYVDLVAWMLARHATLQLPDQDEPTLHAGVRGGCAEVVRLLLAAGADANGVDSLGSTPLHEAAADDERVGIMAVLVAAGANIDAIGPFDETPLDHARTMGAHACADRLVRLGARSNRPAA